MSTKGSPGAPIMTPLERLRSSAADMSPGSTPRRGSDAPSGRSSLMGVLMSSLGGGAGASGTGQQYRMYLKSRFGKHVRMFLALVLLVGSFMHVPLFLSGDDGASDLHAKVVFMVAGFVVPVLLALAATAVPRSGKFEHVMVTGALICICCVELIGYAIYSRNTDEPVLLSLVTMTVFSFVIFTRLSFLETVFSSVAIGFFYTVALFAWQDDEADDGSPTATDSQPLMQAVAMFLAIIIINYAAYFSEVELRAAFQRQHAQQVQLQRHQSSSGRTRRPRGSSAASHPTPNALVRNTTTSSSRKDMMSRPGSLVSSPAFPVASSAVQVMLTRTDEWSFDVFALEEASGGHALYFCGLDLLLRRGFTDVFRVPEQTLQRFLLAIEAMYHDIPYHNSCHAADVLVSVNFLLDAPGVRGVFSELEILSALLACIGHDVRHPGRNNSFLIATQSELALTYNDRSVLENYHCRTIFEVARRPDCNIFAGMDPADAKTVRKTMINMIIATDMSAHFDYFAKLQQLVSASRDRNETEARELILAIVVKMADVSNCAKNVALYQAWTERIMEEFFQQGDEERALGLPISPYMDRTNTCVPKCQMSFIEYVSGPFISEVSDFLDLDILKENCSRNKQLMVEELQQIEAEATASPTNSPPALKVLPELAVGAAPHVGSDTGSGPPSRVGSPRERRGSSGAKLLPPPITRKGPRISFDLARRLSRGRAGSTASSREGEGDGCADSDADGSARGVEDV